MQEVFQFVLLGLGATAIYTLLAQGVVLIYRASGVLNLAQGALAVLGAYIFVQLRDQNHWPTVVAAVVAVVLLGVIGGLIYLSVMRPLRSSPPLTRLFATLGIMVVVQAAAVIKYGQQPISTGPILPHQLITIFGTPVPEDRLWLFGIAVLLSVGLSLHAKFTLSGLAASAVAENERAAATLGWSPDRIAAVSWSVGGALAAVAGIFIVPLTGLQVSTLTELLIVAFAAALVGGFKSHMLTLVGAAVIGISQSEAASYVTTPGASDIIPFVIILIVLIVRGRGLPLRSHLVEKMPEIGTGRIRVVPLVVLTAGLAALMLGVFSVELNNAMIVSFGVATMLLSIVVLTGYAGQLSLGQYAVGGTSALVAGRLVAAEHWPFIAAIVVAVIASALVGLIFALPALRTRGVNLAVVTLGLGAAMYSAVFENPSYTGGATGTTPGPQKFLGINLDPLHHASHYAIFCLLAFVVVIVLVCNLRKSAAGRSILAIRTNERAAASLGVNVLASKAYAFAVSSAIAGVAGILIAFSGYTVDFSAFDPLSSINAVVLAVVGSVAFAIGSLFGATLALGGIGTVITNHIFGNNAGEWIVLLGGVSVILLLIQNPNGMASYNVAAMQKLLKRWRKSPQQDEPKPALVVTARREAPPVAPAATLVADKLTVQLGGVLALSEVDLTVAAGEVVGLIGPNGAGKTTFIDAVSGYVRLTKGRVHLGEREIGGLAPYARSRLGVARSFQSIELFDEITVEENLRVAADSRSLAGYIAGFVRPRGSGLSDYLEAVVAEFSLAPYLDSKPRDLSHGTRRLIGIARALATGPSILLLDEPAAGLDRVETEDLTERISRLAAEWKLGVLVVEHDMSLVMKACHRVAVLEYGRKIAEGTPAEISENDQVVQAYFGSMAEIGSSGAIETVSSEAVESTSTEAI
jgi:ABC-type branched-subunit amino acid transport system ATPase component/branched-subunit amino acid ABC-type transport system permease component